MSAPSVLEYARYYDLTIDARSQNILGLINCVPIQHNNCNDLSREPPWPDYDELLRDDKLQVSREAITLLAECKKKPPAPDWDSVLEESRPAQRFRIETPMLISNHTRDMEWFQKGVDLQKLLLNCRETSKRESTEIDGLPDIVEICDRSAKSISTEIGNERIETTLDVLRILADYSRDHWKEQDMEEIINQDLKPTKRRAIEPLTPLLTPQTFSDEEIMPCLPALPQLDLEPRSECSLDADDLLMQVERASKVEDQVCTSEVEARSPTTVRAILEETSMLAPVDHIDFPAAHPTIFEPTPEANQGLTFHDLKVEIPMVLSPPQSEQKQKCGKRVAFKNMFEEFINFPSPDKSEDGVILTKEQNPDQLLIQRLERFEADMKEEIMNSKPDISNRALRVQLPTLDDVGIADPRANAASTELLVQSLRRTGITSIKTEPAAETKLNWVPIPRKLTQIDLNEHAEGPESIEQFIKKPNKILSSEQLLYKEPGLRLLDADDEDDDIMDQDSELALALMAGVPEKVVPQKRHMEELITIGGSLPRKMPSCNASSKPVRDANAISIEVPTHASSYNDPLPYLPSSSVPQWQRQGQPAANQKDVEDLPEPIFKPKKMKIAKCSLLRNVGISTESFSAGGSLSSFLELRGSKFKKPILPGLVSQEGYDSFRSIAEMDTDPIVVSQRTCPSRGGTCQPLARSGPLRQPNENIEVPSTPNGERSVASPVILPEIPKLTGQRTVIVDSALVNDRQLLSFLERQGKHSLTIIYRDLHGKPNVILNPKTCIMYTTFQALTQRSLPGQMPKQCISTPQEVIRHLALEFETTFVLVTVSASLKASISDSQMNTLADFSRFCVSVGSGSRGMHVVPLWIPTEDNLCESMGKGSLCRWTWSLISRHAFRNMTTPSSMGKAEHIGMIQEETLWEVFMRRAGMNAMAAQVVLGRLKRPEGHPHDGVTSVGRSESERTWGLGRFVSMPPEERLKLFSGLVGVGAIERINNVLDCI